MFKMLLNPYMDILFIYFPKANKKLLNIWFPFIYKIRFDVKLIFTLASSQLSSHW